MSAVSYSNPRPPITFVIRKLGYSYRYAFILGSIDESSCSS